MAASRFNLKSISSIPKIYRNKNNSTEMIMYGFIINVNIAKSSVANVAIDRGNGLSELHTLSNVQRSFVREHVEPNEPLDRWRGW